jgi:hypothetical protein
MAGNTAEQLNSISKAWILKANLRGMDRVNYQTNLMFKNQSKTSLDLSLIGARLNLKMPVAEQTKNKSNRGQSRKVPKTDDLTSVVIINLQEVGLQRISMSDLIAVGFTKTDMYKGRFVLTNSLGAQVPSRFVNTGGGDYLERGFCLDCRADFLFK